MLWYFQMNSKGTRPSIHMYHFPPNSPPILGCHITLSRVPCALYEVLVGYPFEMWDWLIPTLTTCGGRLLLTATSSPADFLCSPGLISQAVTKRLSKQLTFSRFCNIKPPVEIHSQVYVESKGGKRKDGWAKVLYLYRFCCCLVSKLCLTVCNPLDCSTPGFPVLYLPEFAQTHAHEAVMPSNHLIICCHLLLLPSFFPSIRIFSRESALHIRWPKYWSFSFSNSPSNEQSRLISFRMGWFDLLAVQGTLKSLLQHHSSKASIL